MPDDIKELASPVLSHRLLLDAEAEFSGVTVEDVIGQLLSPGPPARQPRRVRCRSRPQDQPASRSPVSRRLAGGRPGARQAQARLAGHHAGRPARRCSSRSPPGCSACRLGWQELFLVAACCALALLIAVGFVIGRPGLDITIELDPARVSVGSPAAGRLVATNRSRARLRALAVEVPVGRGRATFQLPSLAGGASHDELFVVPTDRRAVIPIGPPSAVRTDPLGLLRRDAVEQTTVELFVHPKIIGLDSLSPGLQRDLEGQATRDLSTSDLAFHTLRDYATGDDWRHVHWRSTAKAGKLLVRQFQDTRRSQLTVVVDGARASYRTEDEFELAMSVAGSICVRAVTRPAGRLPGRGQPRGDRRVAAPGPRHPGPRHARRFRPGPADAGRAAPTGWPATRPCSCCSPAASCRSARSRAPPCTSAPTSG